MEAFLSKLHARLPRTICLERAGADAEVPVGFPIIKVLDQRKLPDLEEYLYISEWKKAVDAIKELAVRGAPAIGIMGACAVALKAFDLAFEAECEAGQEDGLDTDEMCLIRDRYLVSLADASECIGNARPTAVNLMWAVNNCMSIVVEELDSGSTFLDIAETLYEYAENLIAQDEEANLQIGSYGASLLPDKCSVLTHCNAGSLATAFYGTALGVIYSAYADGKIKRVYADETMPVRQGARLTVWELSKAGVPTTLICDDMAAYVMSNGLVDAVIVGADRICANGDVVNKIGTFGLAVLAREFNIPFYVAAPTSTIDPSLSCGQMVQIEERSHKEVLKTPINGVDVINPAFDMTPASYVTCIVTESGIFKPTKILEALK